MASSCRSSSYPWSFCPASSCRCTSSRSATSGWSPPAWSTSSRSGSCSATTTAAPGGSAARRGSTEVTERFDDGRLNIVVTGERPFRVLDRFEGADYPAGEVEPVDSSADAGPAASAEAAQDAFAELVRRVGGEPPPELSDYDAYAIAARVELPAETKQELLEERSEQERMTVLAAALSTLVDAVARSRDVAERAKLNGKVVIGDL